MQPVTKTVYEAFDGQMFETAAEARAYEKENAHLAIVGLTVEQALAIVSREDSDRADAVENLGKIIERTRIAAGELRRRPSAPADNGTEPPAQLQEGEEREP